MKSKKLISRINRMSSDFWIKSKTKGITHKEWCVYYFNMMRAGERLKATGVKYNPRSNRFPVEFKEMFR